MSEKTILVVEDTQDNLDLIQFLLEGAGYRVLTAMDGETCLALTRRHLPDLLLLDLAIPEPDGWEVAATLKGDSATRGVTIVAITARTMPDDRRRAMAAGCDGFISKPIDVAGFAEEVHSFIVR